MAMYTVTLNDLLENGFDIGLQDYPIFDEAYREGLNHKIKEHFRFREIGFETAALFKFFLNRTMNEEMPYFNQLYESTRLTILPLTNKNITETAESGSSGSSTSSGHGKSIGSDTPQGMLESSDINAARYASNAAITDDATEAASTNEASSTHTVTGYEGNDPSGLLIKYRETMINIDMLVMDKLNTCFMCIW